MIVVLGSRLFFFNDDWDYLLSRATITPRSLFAPHNQHLVAEVVLSFKWLVDIFGLKSQIPYRLQLALAVSLLGVIVFLWVRRRAGSLIALCAAALLLFLGPAWEVLLWSQVGETMSLVTGIGALLLLEDGDTPWRNIGASALLVSSIGFSDLGLSFVVAAAVACVLRRRLAQLWIPGIPALLFAAWWIGYGSKVPSAFSVTNLPAIPEYTLDSIASALSSMLGVSPEPGSVVSAYDWGRPLLAVAAVAIAFWLYRGGRPGRRVLIPLAAGLTFWVLAAAGYMPGRPPDASRYQLISGTLIILIASELFRPVRLRPIAAPILVGATLIAALANLGPLKVGYNSMHLDATVARADLGALNLMRGHVAPTFTLTPAVAGEGTLSDVTAVGYFDQTALHGSVGDSPHQLLTAPIAAQRAADDLLVSGYGIKMTPLTFAPSEYARCRPLADAREIVLTPPNVTLLNATGQPVTLTVRRFSPMGSGDFLGSLGGHAATRINLPADSTRVAWHLESSNASGLAMCR